MSQFILHIHALELHQGSFRLDIREWLLPRSCITLLVGPNGAGKTTFMEASIGTRGTRRRVIDFQGKGHKDLRSIVGFVPTDVSFLLGSRGKDIADFEASLYSRWDRSLFLEYVRKWRLPIERKLKTFSMGERRKFYLALALSRHVQALILDEPLAALDPQMSYEFIDLLRDIALMEGIGCWVSSNVLDPFLPAVERVDFMANGAIIASFTADELKGSSSKEIWRRVYP